VPDRLTKQGAGKRANLEWVGWQAGCGWCALVDRQAGRSRQAGMRVGVCRPADGQVYMCAWVGMQAGMSADWGCHCHCCWCAVTVMSLLVP
jgi:hypothetical protein